MFGGFNNEYYNDLHCLNVSENRLESIQSAESNNNDVLKFIESEKFADTCITTVENERIKCHREMLMKYFPGRIELDHFLSEIEGKATSE